MAIIRPPRYGNVGRLAVIVPSPNCVLEPDVLSLLPPGVSAHFARIGSQPALSMELLRDMADESVREAAKLTLTMPAAIGYGCTSGSFFKGEEYDRTLAERIADACGGVPVTTASTAAVVQLRALGVSTLAFCTPYEEYMHRLGVQYFTGQGFTIVGQANLGFAGQRDIQNLDHQTMRSLVLRGDSAAAEAVFVSCTGLPILSLLPELTEELGKPVLSSNLTFVRTLLQLAGLETLEPREEQP